VTRGGELFENGMEEKSFGGAEGRGEVFRGVAKPDPRRETIDWVPEFGGARRVIEGGGVNL